MDPRVKPEGDEEGGLCSNDPHFCVAVILSGRTPFSHRPGLDPGPLFGLRECKVVRVESFAFHMGRLQMIGAACPTSQHPRHTRA
ncbi:hypothetical protein GCM10007879_28280 [Maritalea porphyrae]|uniref:Uncharacterized protein n=1 Tax=Maritalea porphyrae TaxID=880732 RepID=A0ABQ5UUL7_9HYPH|nr:hypothetical protein GCM10007879_28280 [Maritalea porphyrae]